MRIGFLGGGNMARAMVLGLLQGGVPADTLAVVDKHTEKRNFFAKKGVNVGESLHDIAFDVLIVAVKPQVLIEVIAPFAMLLMDKLVVSVAAGVTLETLATALPKSFVVRAMPNTPVAQGVGVVGIFCVHKEYKQTLAKIFAPMGDIVWVDNEMKLHAITALAGSAPAYFYYVFEQMICAGVQMGLDDDTAKRLAIAAAQGASILARDNNPAMLRREVTSPNGTTHAAICHFENENMGKIWQVAMQQCYARSVELSK